MVQFIDSSLFAFVYPVALIGSVIAGYFSARYFYFNRDIAWKGSGIENGIIGFFGLILSFTLLMSGNIQKERTAIVHQLADGIAQMKRTADILPVKEQDSISEYLRNHLAIHITFFEERINKPDSLIKDLNSLHESFWQQFSRKEDTISVGEGMQLLPVYNQLNSSSYKLAYSYMERVPVPIILLILISSLLIGILVGFMNGFHEKIHYLVPLIYIVIVGLMVQSIRDLDNPYAGTIRPKYDNLKDLRNLINAEQHSD